jgi:hypothetical protein
MRSNSYGGGDARPSGFQVRAKTRNVVAYHEDPDHEGRPLLLMMSGAGIALLCLMFIAVLCFRTFYEHRIDTSSAYLGVSLLFCFYVLGVFLFCYAYELYDTPKALRLTIIAAFVSLVFLVLVIVSLSTLAKMKDGVGALADEADSGGDGSLARTLFSYAGVNSSTQAEQARQRPGNFDDYSTPEERPFLVKCQKCREMFTPAPPDALCPYCGKAALSS